VNLLLDTCAVLYLSANDPKVAETTREAVAVADRMFVSAVTAAELACLQQRKRIELPSHWKPWFRKAVEVNGWEVLPVDWEVMEEAYSLPETFHADPADRMIVATARLRRCHVLTTDAKLHLYPHVDACW
jgi:PIN domain nuclease of toxin-antitoxin system